MIKTAVFAIRSCRSRCQRRSSGAMLPEKRLPHAKNLRVGRFSEPGRVYFVTKCVERSTGITLTVEPFASCVCNAILHRKRSGLWHLLAFVLMPDHLHLLVASGERETLSKTMGSFSQFIASEINRLLNRQGHLWQHGFYEHAIRKAVEKCPALTEYIHQNPVRKGLCDSPEQWPWSTANANYATEVETEWFW